MSSKSVWQECQVRVSQRSVKQECPVRVSYKMSSKKCQVRVSFTKSVSSKSVLQECQVRVSSKKGVLQECHLSVSRQGVPQVGSLENLISIVSVLQHTCRHSGSWASSCCFFCWLNAWLCRFSSFWLEWCHINCGRSNTFFDPLSKRKQEMSICFHYAKNIVSCRSSTKSIFHEYYPFVNKHGYWNSTIDYIYGSNRWLSY